MRNIILGLLGIAVLVGAVLLARGDRPDVPAASSARADTSDQPRERFEASDKPVAPLARLSTTSAAFSSADDLHAFADGLRSRAGEGDGEATFYIARTLDYCRDYALDPAGYMAATSLVPSKRREVASAYKRSRERVAHRCRGYAAANARITSNDILETLRTSASQGNIAAEATLFSHEDIEALDPVYVRELAARVLASRNPEAYLAISSGMGTRTSGLPLDPESVAGTEYATLAWQVAACRLGLDCSANAPIVTQYCANGGVCGSFSSLDNLIFDGLVPRSDADIVRGMSTELIGR